MSHEDGAYMTRSPPSSPFLPDVFGEDELVKDGYSLIPSEWEERDRLIVGGESERVKKCHRQNEGERVHNTHTDEGGRKRETVSGRWVQTPSKINYLK